MFEGLKNLGSMAGLIKQAQELSQKMAGMREELSKRRVQGTAGGGMVKCELTGSMDCVAFQIEPALLTGDDREVLEDLLTAAVNDALAKAKALQLEQMQLMPGGMPFSLPDMDESNSS